MAERIIAFMVVAVLIASVLFRVPIELARRLMDALTVQGAIKTDRVFVAQLNPQPELTTVPTAVSTGKSRSSVSLYQGERRVGELVLVERAPAGRDAFPYLETRGRVERYELRKPLRSGMTVKVYRGMVNNYLVFYDSEGNYVGYWFIIWET